MPVHNKRDIRATVGRAGTGPEMYMHDVALNRFKGSPYTPLSPRQDGERRLSVQRTHAFRKPWPVPPTVSCLPTVLHQCLSDVGAIEEVNYLGIGSLAGHGA